MRFSALAWLFCFPVTLRAQYPPDTQWRKIRTPHFDIIFPSEIEAAAQQTANALETLYDPLTRNLGGAPKRTSVLLSSHDVTRYTGGYVSLFSRMATFNMMPGQGGWARATGPPCWPSTKGGTWCSSRR
jgi:hypothetical protein